MGHTPPDHEPGRWIGWPSLMALIIAMVGCGPVPLEPSPSATPVPATAVSILIQPTVLAATPTPSPPLATPTSAPIVATRPATPSRTPTSVPTQPTPTPAARPTGPAMTIRSGPTRAKVIALTYDAGADRGAITDLLATLRRDHVKVTFGITGRWAESNPELTRRMIADGHELMNHTYSHPSFTGESASPPITHAEARRAELAKTEAIIQSIGGVSTKPLFRPPYGDQDSSVLRDVGLAGYAYSVLWTVDSLGWRGTSASEIVARCLRLAEPGAIYVMHIGGASHDIEATPAIIDGLREKGYRLVTIGELLGIPSP